MDRWVGAVARIILACCCVAFAASAATAQTTAYASGQGSPNQITLSIPVTASVGGHCGFATAPSGTHNEPNFDDHGWSHDFAFVLDCTGPARIAVVSANGALKSAAGTASGYTNSAPYDVTLNVARNSGGAVTATCAVANLTTGGSCGFRGPANGSQGLSVPTSSTNQSGSYVRVSAPAYAGSNVLVAGDYADTLIVTVSAAP